MQQLRCRSATRQRLSWIFIQRGRLQSRCNHLRLGAVAHSFSSSTRKCQQATVPIARKWQPTTISLVLGITTFGVASWLYFQDHERRLDGFQKFHLEASEPVSPTSSLLTLRAFPWNSPIRTASENLERRGVWSIEVAQPEMGISRMYTPLPLPNAHHLPPSDQDERIKLLVRHGFEGEMSSYLRSLKLGHVIYVRGPHLEYEVPDSITDIVFIAGGTGISPAMQVLRTLRLRQEQDATARNYSMHILWANRTKSDALEAPNSRQVSSSSTSDESIHTLLSELASDDAVPVKVDVKYFIDEERSFINAGEISRVCKKVSNKDTGQPSTKQVILVSGPDGFVNFVAGPKDASSSRVGPSPPRGLLSELDLRGWTVWKL